jgi:hypothetical protein
VLQVHSANLLASSHQRVPIARAVPEQDDSHFRVPERTSVFEADPAVAENPTKVRQSSEKEQASGFLYEGFDGSCVQRLV